VDQRQEAIDQLSALVDVSVIPSGNTLTLTTANGTALVTGQQSNQLQTQTTAAGLEDVFSNGQYITSTIVSGQLGGTLQARDQQIPAIQNQLDTLAAGLANSVNAVQVGGFDLNGNAGTDLFNPPPAGVTGAAAGLCRGHHRSVADCGQFRRDFGQQRKRGSHVRPQQPNDRFRPDPHRLLFRDRIQCGQRRGQRLGGAERFVADPAAVERSAIFGVGRLARRRSGQHGAVPGRLFRVRLGHYHDQRHDVHGGQYGHADGLILNGFNIDGLKKIRVNPNPYPDLISDVGLTQQQVNTDEQEIASGSSVNVPSDNPAAAAALIQNAAETAQADQFQRSIGSVQGEIQSADSTLSSVITALQQAIDLGVEGANGTLNSSDRAAIVTQVQGIQNQLISLANLTYQGNYVFSGTANQTTPYVLDPNSTSGVSYQGNTGVNNVTLGNQFSLQTNLPGSQLFSEPGNDVFQSIQDLITSLQSNTGISTAVTESWATLRATSRRKAFFTATL
jgi:flagellar hook-associated protein 3 FlgL